MYIFKQLQKLLSEKSQAIDPAIPNLTVSEKIKQIKLGEEIIVGGKITRTGKDMFTKGNWYVELDDGVGLSSIYLLAQIYDENKDIIKEGNVIIARGFVAQRPTTKDRYIICVSLDLVPAEEGGQKGDSVDQ
jgi:hypothetical protein